MTTEADHTPDEHEGIWRQVLEHGHGTRKARMLNAIPRAPRCAICRTPFSGIGGAIMKMMGHRPSRGSPKLCNICDDLLPRGGAEVEIGVLFCDVRGSTGLGESMGAIAFAALLNRFYVAAMNPLLNQDAVIDKMVGDEVMALFIPSVCGPEYGAAAVRAAEGIMHAVGHGSGEEPWLPLGIGAHVGTAYVGKVGTESVNDLTAVGDTINTASRLAAQAAAGEIVLSESAYQAVADRYSGLEQTSIQVRGRDEPMNVRVIQPEHLRPG